MQDVVQTVPKWAAQQGEVVFWALLRDESETLKDESALVAWGDFSLEQLMLLALSLVEHKLQGP